jgi:hypothetical protein
MFNGGGSDQYLHPIFAIIEISRHLWDYQPFQILNACIELIIRRAFCIRFNYPLAAYLSLVQIDEGIQKNNELPFGAYTFTFPMEYQVIGVDVTWYQDMMVAFYIQDLKRLQKRQAFIFTSGERLI